MDATPLAFLSGLVGGAFAGVVGGGTIIVFPSVICLGFPATTASAVSIVALTIANGAAVLADRRRIPPRSASYNAAIVSAVVSSILGAITLAYLTPDPYFQVLVPALTGFATLLFLFPNLLQGAGLIGPLPQIKFSLSTVIWIAICGFYGGFFGGSMTIALLGVLTLTTGGDIRQLNVLKNHIAWFVGLAACAVFLIRWGVGGLVYAKTTVFGAALLFGAALGGYAGGALLARIPPNLMRWLVALVGALATFDYANRYWLGNDFVLASICTNS